MISLIWAQDEKRGIGKNNTLPWNIEDDFNFFLNTTLNNTIVMGKNTYISIGGAINNRKNIVITHNKEDLDSDVISYNSFNEVELYMKNNSATKFYISGGESIYKYFIDKADELLVTFIEGDFLCDTFAPEINKNKFHIVSKQNGVGGIKHTFTAWEKTLKV